MHTKSWSGHDDVLDDVMLLLFPSWFQIDVTIIGIFMAIIYILNNTFSIFESK